MKRTTPGRSKPIGTPRTQRLRKLECDADCGYLVYVSRRWMREGLPACPCGGRLWPSDLEDAAAVLGDADMQTHPAVQEYYDAVRSVMHGQAPAWKSLRHTGRELDLDGTVAAKLERSRRTAAERRRLDALRPAQASSDPIPF